jgi:hypothetical protein
MVIDQNIVISVEPKDFARLDHVDAVHDVSVAFRDHREFDILWLLEDVITVLANESKISAILN